MSMKVDARGMCEDVQEIATGRVRKLRELVDAVDTSAFDRDGPDRRNWANLLLARHALQYAEAATLLFERRLIAPSAAVVRSIMETTWVWRWVLADAANAEEWFAKGDAQIAADGEGAIAAHRVAGAEIGDDFVTFVQRVRQETTTDHRIRFHGMAIPHGGEASFRLWYTKLCGWTHPNPSGMWAAHDPDHDVFGDLVIIGGPLAYGTTDAVRVCRGWIEHREVPDPNPVLVPNLAEWVRKTMIEK